MELFIKEKSTRLHFFSLARTKRATKIDQGGQSVTCLYIKILPGKHTEFNTQRSRLL